MKIHVFVCSVLLICIFVLWALENRYYGSDIWAGGQPSREFEDPEYQERIYPGNLMRTRANTWSNLAYVVVGLYAIGLAGADRHCVPHVDSFYLVSTPGMGALFGVACCYLGIGSGLFHASLLRWGQQVDVAAMYAPQVVLIAVNLGRLKPRFGKTRAWPVLATASFIACVLLFVYKWSMSSRVVLPLLSMAILVFVIRDLFTTRRPHVLLWIPVSFLLTFLAVMCRESDIAGTFSGPDAVLQGHAVWHILTAGSLTCLYVYHRLIPDNSSAQNLTGADFPIKV